MNERIMFLLSSQESLKVYGANQLPMWDDLVEAAAPAASTLTVPASSLVPVPGKFISAPSSWKEATAQVYRVASSRSVASGLITRSSCGSAKHQSWSVPPLRESANWSGCTVAPSTRAVD